MKRRNSAEGNFAATIKQVAERAKVSTATVSRALSDPHKVRQPTRERVLAAVKELHYVSDGVARRLVSRKTKLIGVVIPEISNTIFSLFLTAIQAAAQAADFTIVEVASQWTVELEPDLIRKLVELRVEGIILTGAERDQSAYDLIDRHDIPYVITWKWGSHEELPTISFSNRQAGARAAKHLASLGHRRIGAICGRSSRTDRGLGRRVGFEDEMLRQGLEIDRDLIIESELEFTDGRAAMAQLLNHRDPPTAVFCGTDTLAIGAIHECRLQGLTVPDDISIVGTDDMEIGNFVTPMLTSVNTSTREMGRRATEALLRKISGESEIRSTQLPTELIVRESTGRPKTHR